MQGCDIKIIRFTLEDNGFRDLKSLKKDTETGGQGVI
jgi:hypothetical protein